MAAGPDGLRKVDLLKQGRVKAITAFFNLALVVLRQPSDWDLNVTTLIPKEGKDPTDPASYRPITISSILNRVYLGLMDDRLKEIFDLGRRQKGFTTEQGCFNNINILNEAISTAKKGKCMTIVQIDISKAFDSLPHDLIQTALMPKGCPTKPCV